MINSMHPFLAITLAAVSTILLNTAPRATLTQGFPWEIFKPRTLNEVIAITKRTVGQEDTGFLAQDQLESKVQVTYTGESRPIPKDRAWFISTWFGMLRSSQKKLAENYQLEYLYKDGTDEYWLPTSRPITKYFDKELKPGDKMDLYLISIGAFRAKDKIDCVLLVEEFQKAKSP